MPVWEETRNPLDSPIRDKLAIVRSVDVDGSCGKFDPRDLVGMGGEDRLRALRVGQGGEQRKEAAVENRGDSDGAFVETRSGALLRLRTGGNERRQDGGADKRLIADHHDDGIECRSLCERVSDARADRAANAEPPIRVMRDVRFERAQLYDYLFAFVADDNHHRGTPGLVSHAGSAVDERFAVVPQELFRLAEARRATGGEDDCGDDFHFIKRQSALRVEREWEFCGRAKIAGSRWRRPLGFRR